MVALMDALGHERFAIYGTDTGMPIAYAVAPCGALLLAPKRGDLLAKQRRVVHGVKRMPVARGIGGRPYGQ